MIPIRYEINYVHITLNIDSKGTAHVCTWYVHSAHSGASQKKLINLVVWQELKIQVLRESTPLIKHKSDSLPHKP